MSTRIRVLKLDPKTSIPLRDHDRTDEHFFHGFGILKDAQIDNADNVKRLEDLLTDIAEIEWRRDVVRDADYGIRISTTKGDEDLLLCTYCTPAVVSRTRESTEVSLSSSSTESFRAILTAALEHD
jgi:hypothetical protein